MTRSLRRVVATAVVLSSSLVSSGVGVLGAPSAEASNHQTDDGGPNTMSGFVWANDPDDFQYAPPADWQWNSTGATNTVLNLEAGDSLVVFEGLSAVGGHVQVTAYGSPDAHCGSTGWGSGKGGIVVGVRCYNNEGGEPVAAQFNAMFTAPTSAPDGVYAYLWAEQEDAASYTPSLAYQYSTSGSPGTVTRTSPGAYAVTLPGGVSANGAAIVTAYMSTNTCKVRSNTVSGADEIVRVRCYDVAGSLADTEFGLLYTADTNMVGENSLREAYVRADQPKEASYSPAVQWNDPAPPLVETVNRVAKGVYEVLLNYREDWGTQSHVEVTAYGKAVNQCRIESWYSPAPALELVRVLCVRANGALKDAAFTMHYVQT